MKYLENKTVLVTGGGGGIGWGLCLEFARNGATVVVTDVDDKRGEDVLKDILEVSDGHLYYHLDLLDIDSFDDILEKIYKEVGKIDVLFNNAGIGTSENVLNATQKEWTKIINTNLTGHMFLTQKVVKKMIKNGVKGNVIFTSSVHQDIPSSPHYTASKAAIKALVKTMAIELAPHGIRVNGIAPGGIYIREKTEDPNQANDEPTVLLGGKNGIPRDIGRMGVIFASDYWSRHITGEVITVSGAQYQGR
ncbi:SDR family NAD(P)-dependent oxidoreductase [Patescibacteria group bacterium]